MDRRFGCAHLSDDDFLHHFEECQLAPGTFHHADHIRLAWLYVRRNGPAQAEPRLLTGICKMASQAGAPEKFRYTTTLAWARLVASSLRSDAERALSFEDWIEDHCQLLNKDLLLKFYSAGVLETPVAHASWVAPDLAPLP